MAVRRLMRELAELRAAPTPDFAAEPLADNLFEWHFTIRGPPEGGFQGGRFHGRISFPPDYPFKPPNISFLNQNGRFEVGKKICLSITSYHPEFWRPAWGIRTALVAIISFFPTKAEGAIGALDWTEAERRICAEKSRKWSCGTCGANMSSILPEESEAPSQKYNVDPEIVLSVRDNSTTTSPVKASNAFPPPTGIPQTPTGDTAAAADASRSDPPHACEDSDLISSKTTQSPTHADRLSQAGSSSNTANRQPSTPTEPQRVSPVETPQTQLRNNTQSHARGAGPISNTNFHEADALAATSTQRLIDAAIVLIVAIALAIFVRSAI